METHQDEPSKNLRGTEKCINEGDTYIDLKNLGLGGEDMKELVDILNRHPSITEVDLYRNNIEKNAGLFTQCPQIRVLRFQNNGIGDKDALTLARSGTLQFLDLNETDITEACARELLGLINENFRVSVAGCWRVPKALQVEIGETTKRYAPKKAVQQAPVANIGSAQPAKQGSVRESILTKFFSMITPAQGPESKDHLSASRGNTKNR